MVSVCVKYRLVLPFERQLRGEEDKPLPPSKPRKQYKRSPDGKGSKSEGKRKRPHLEKETDSEVPHLLPVNGHCHNKVPSCSLLLLPMYPTCMSGNDLYMLSCYRARYILLHCLHGLLHLKASTQTILHQSVRLPCVTTSLPQHAPYPAQPRALPHAPGEEVSSSLLLQISSLLWRRRSVWPRPA